MKRKPCMKVPLPASPKRKLRSSSSPAVPPTKTIDEQKTLKATSAVEGEDHPAGTELRSKSPFYKKVVDQDLVGKKKKACAKEITFIESKEKMNEKLQTSSADCTQSCVTPKDTADQSATAVHLANQTDITKDHAADQSGISLNSSYVTLSVAETSSLSQESNSTDTSSQDKLSNSQASRNSFTLSKTSDNSETLDYNDTLTSEERTPSKSVLSPRNRTHTKSGKLNKSGSTLPAVEVVIERDIVEFIDYDNLESRTDINNKGSPPLQEIGRETMPEKSASDAQTQETDMAENEKRQNDILDAEIAEINRVKVDENNNVKGVDSLNENSDQAVMANAYQNEVDACSGRTVDNLRDTNNNISVSEQDNTTEEFPYDKTNGTLGKESGSQRKAIIPVSSVLKEANIPGNTPFSAVVPVDLEPRQLIQARLDASIPLSPITEENAVEKVAKELVNTYGGQNSHRIPDFLQDHTRLSDYDYNTGFGYQQPRDPRQPYTQQQVHQTSEYPNPSARQDIPRDPLGLQGHMTNTTPFGDPQGSSTPEIFNRRPICFSPDDFPSPYHYDAPPTNQWLGTGNSYQIPSMQNTRQSDYFLSENPIGGSSFSSMGQQRNGYRGKGIIDLPSGSADYRPQGSGDFRPAPHIHDNTTMTFTPRSLMESHLSSNICAASLNTSGSRQTYPPPHLSLATQTRSSLRNMDCSSIYPSRDFIEKASGASRPRDYIGEKASGPSRSRDFMEEKASGTGHKRVATPAKIPSFENLVPSAKRRKMRSLSETDIFRDKDGCRLGLHPLEPNGGPPRHKYYVVNPSDATNMSPKALMAKYIDFLILENEQITEISKSVSQPIDIYVTEDMYFMDTLKCRVPFPSKKFMEWVRSFYPKLQLQNLKFRGMPGKSGDLPKGEDKRQTQQVLEDIFYYFQRQVMNLED